MMKKALLFLLLLPVFAFAQQRDVFRIDSLPNEGILLDKGWKWHAGDNPEWAKPGFDDAKWGEIDPIKDIMDIPQLWSNDIVWFRLHLKIDSTFSNRSLALLVVQTGASEFFFDGQKIGGFGKIGKQPEQVLAYAPRFGSNIELSIHNSSQHVLSVRFAVQKKIPYLTYASRRNSCLSLRVMGIKEMGAFLINNLTPYFEFSRFGIFLILSMIHFALYWLNSKVKANFYLFLFAFLQVINLFFTAITSRFIDPLAYKMNIFIPISFCFSSSYLFFLTAVYLIFKQKTGYIFWSLTVYSILGFIFLLTNYHYGFSVGIYMVSFLIPLECIRITIFSRTKRHRGANIIFVGSIFCLLFSSLFLAFIYQYLPAGPNWIYGSLAFNIGAISFPIASSIYMALESSFTSLSLEQKLKEVESLSNLTLKQEREKQEILASQNETLENLVEERTSALKATQSQLIQSEKLASLGELTAGIAHEIQNPLNFVNNFAEVSAELLDDMKADLHAGKTTEAAEIADDLQVNLQKINHHGQRASAIVKGMLEHSRTSTGTKVATDINALADEYLRLSYHGLRAKDSSFNATMETHFDPDLPKIEVIPQDIGRVLLNLINNAFYAVNQRNNAVETLHAMSLPYQPMVTVTTKKLENAIEISVKDNGNGIPEAIKDKIFQPFFTTKPTGQGTGLGLSLAYDIVTKGHGGTLTVSSIPGAETTFEIQLPINETDR